MEKIGVQKDFDRLGRIVIPKELRDRYGFCGTVELVATKDGVLITSPEYRLEKINKDATLPSP